METSDRSVDCGVSVGGMGEIVQIGNVPMYFDTFGASGDTLALLHVALGGGYVIGDFAERLFADDPVLTHVSPLTY